jgi:hypothetical protein
LFLSVASRSADLFGSVLGPSMSVTDLPMTSSAAKPVKSVKAELT